MYLVLQHRRECKNRMDKQSYKAKSKKRYRSKKQKFLLLFLVLAGILALGIWSQNKKAGESGQNLNSSETIKPLENAGLEIHYIDVGQGDATLLLCGEEAMLIDGGGNEMEGRIRRYLKNLGIKELAYVVGTHPDADHIGGLDEVISVFDCNRVILPEIKRDNVTYRDVTDAIRYRRAEELTAKVGEVYPFGEASFTIVAPEGSYEEFNNHSVGLLFTYGETRFLFVGDAEGPAEEQMLGSGIDLHADVLKIGHHGSSDSTSQAFLDAVKPTHAVISCGRANEHGHPHTRVLNLLKKRDISVYRTDLQGTVVLQSDGRVIRFLTEPTLDFTSGWDLQAGEN